MSQWLVVQGVRYDFQEAIQKASIRSLTDLQKAAGISVNNIVDVLEGLSGLQDPTEIFDSVDSLQVFAAIVFLAKRKAGEATYGWDDALEISLADVQFDFEDEPEAEADDPKDPQTTGGEGSGEATA